MIEINLDSAKTKSTGIYYHPLEIINWKYGSYLMNSGRYKEAMPYYIKAQRICFSYKDYDALMVTGLAIQAETICCRINNGDNKLAERDYQVLIKNIQTVHKRQKSKSSKLFIEKMCGNIFVDGDFVKKPEFERLWKMSRAVTY